MVMVEQVEPEPDNKYNFDFPLIDCTNNHGERVERAPCSLHYNQNEVVQVVEQSYFAQVG